MDPVKLGTLKYQILNESFNKPGRLIVGFKTSQRTGGNPDVSSILRTMSLRNGSVELHFISTFEIKIYRFRSLGYNQTKHFLLMLP